MKEQKTPMMQLMNGKSWRILDPRVEDVNWYAIAKGLSQTARFCGQTCSAPYSVAQHCVHVASLVPRSLHGHALLHDAHEFALGDVSSPLKWALKELGAFHGWERLEKQHDQVLHKAARLSWPLNKEDSAILKRADAVMYVTEKRDLMANFDFPEKIGFTSLNVQPAYFKVTPWSSETARDIWLDQIMKHLKF